MVRQVPKEAGEPDEVEAGEAEAGEADEVEAGEADEVEAGEADQEADQVEAGEADQVEAGEEVEVAAGEAKVEAEERGLRTKESRNMQYKFREFIIVISRWDKVNKVYKQIDPGSVAQPFERLPENEGGLKDPFFSVKDQDGGLHCYNTHVQEV